MENKSPQVKPKTKVNVSAIRVSLVTHKAMSALLAKINKKQHGKRVKVDALIMKILAKISEQDVSELQEASLSGRDRMEQNYRAYCVKFGSITMDQFLDVISRETLPQILKADAAKSHPQNAAISDEKKEK